MSAGNTTEWGMLKDALRRLIDEDLRGYRVTEALFTSYAFEPEFFETSVLPLLLSTGLERLSMHSVVRRLQVEDLLRQEPIAIDVYFDAGVVVPGCPLLPYEMLPMRLGGEFHGKVILLQLQDEQGNARMVLGAGSANLTRAGWWENVECWHFMPPFDPQRPPAGCLPGLLALFRCLARRGPLGGAAKALQRALRGAEPLKAKKDEPIFAVFAPGQQRFTAWLREKMKHRGGADHLEVISPYFAEAGHADLVDSLLEAAGAEGLRLWLPLDPWETGGPAALIEESRYGDLSNVEAVQWCSFAETALAASRDPSQTPRFLHAKVIRRPGNFCFMGSVNFSNKAFDVNFEAGFLFRDDTADNWLRACKTRPTRFLVPQQQARHEGADDAGPQLSAEFDWRTRMLSVDFLKAPVDVKVRLNDAQGVNITSRSSSLPIELAVDAKGSLYRDLQTNPWIKAVFDDGASAVVWVQQRSLEFRPPPVDLQPDVWRILELWRSLAPGDEGSGPRDFEPLEVLLRRRGDDGEQPPDGEPPANLFEEMAAAHGCFYLLRARLSEEAAQDNQARLEYYFGAPRPDTLATLVERLEQPAVAEQDAVDPITGWVLLHWVIQICADHGKQPQAKALKKRAENLLGRLLAQEPLSALDAKWLEWASQTFLCPPGRERAVARRFMDKVEA
jgi:hypothetical protein